MNFYNEIEAYPAQWLRNLIDAGHIAKGKVDERSIEEIEAKDLEGAIQAHFFAGIGVWSYALRLAGWPDDAPVWTGSCPCQPFSTAGRGKGTDDARHLFPAWLGLIKECRPAIVFGEQVASPAGRDWFAFVRTEMEALGYEVGAADLCAAGVGAPHIRQRLYFGARRVGDTGSTGSRRDGGAVFRAQAEGEGEGRESWGVADELVTTSNANWLADSNESRLEGRRLSGDSSSQWAPWQDSLVSWIPCSDRKQRPIEPGTFPLVDGVANRVGRIRAYGNAIVPQVAAQFITAFMQA